MREVFRPAAGTGFCVGCITYFLVLYQAVDCRFRRYRFEASCLYPLVESMYVACMFINVRMPPVLNFDECLVMFRCLGTILVSTRYVPASVPYFVLTQLRLSRQKMPALFASHFKRRLCSRSLLTLRPTFERSHSSHLRAFITRSRTAVK